MPAPARGLSWLTALRLARVSNLPTVWTNVLAGVVLAGGEAWSTGTLLLILALSLLYSAGMYLNDAFDHEIDAAERPGRPIPSGAAALNTVFFLGFALLLGGLVVLVPTGYLFAETTGWRPLLSGLALAAAILFYDWHHKRNPLSPVFMALCRLLAYLTAGYAVTATPPAALYLGAVAGFAHIVGLTYAARQENLAEVGNLWPLAVLAVPLGYGLWLASGGIVALLLWLALAACVGFAVHRLRRRSPGDVPQAVVTLIAATALLDGVLVSGAGRPELGALAGAAFALTLLLQRWVRGT
ncbi:MAG TPA: UbiA family prenyltransferase [Geminicoccaceae bacterium]|nr:UbiA family prenyltransferase [Geminicoccaceae bacterium]